MAKKHFQFILADSFRCDVERDSPDWVPKYVHLAGLHLRLRPAWQSLESVNRRGRRRDLRRSDRSHAPPSRRPESEAAPAGWGRVGRIATVKEIPQAPNSSARQ